MITEKITIIKKIKEKVIERYGIESLETQLFNDILLFSIKGKERISLKMLDRRYPLDLIFIFTKDPFKVLKKRLIVVDEEKEYEINPDILKKAVENGEINIVNPATGNVIENYPFQIHLWFYFC